MQRICGNHPKKPRWRCGRTVTETCFSQSKKSGRVETTSRAVTSHHSSEVSVADRWNPKGAFQADTLRQPCGLSSRQLGDCSGRNNQQLRARHKSSDDGSQNALISHISITMLVEQNSTSSRSEKTIPLFPNAFWKFRRPIHVVYGTCTWR